MIGKLTIATLTHTVLDNVFRYYKLFLFSLFIPKVAPQARDRTRILREETSPS